MRINASVSAVENYIKRFIARLNFHRPKSAISSHSSLKPLFSENHAYKNSFYAFLLWLATEKYFSGGFEGATAWRADSWKLEKHLKR